MAGCDFQAVVVGAVPEITGEPHSEMGGSAPRRERSSTRGLTAMDLLLLALGVVGDLGELGFCWSGAVGSWAWWSSLVVIGHC